MYGILIITNKMLMENNSYYYSVLKFCRSVIMKNVSNVLTTYVTRYLLNLNTILISIRLIYYSMPCQKEFIYGI